MSPHHSAAVTLPFQIDPQFDWRKGDDGRPPDDDWWRVVRVALGGIAFAAAVYGLLVGLVIVL